MNGELYCRFHLAPESKERASDDQHKIKMHSMITFWNVGVDFDDIHNARLGLKEVQRVVILQAKVNVYWSGGREIQLTDCCS